MEIKFDGEVKKTKLDGEIEKEIIDKNLSGVPSVDQPWKKYYTSDMLNFDIPNLSLLDYLYYNNKDRLNLTALRYFDKTISYEELFDNISDCGKKFSALGVKQNDNVGIAMPLTPETIYMIYGLNSIGARANLIDPRVPSDRMNFYLNLSDSQKAVIIDSYFRTMQSAAKNSKLDTIIDVSALESFKDSSDFKHKKLELLYSLKNFREILAKTSDNFRKSPYKILDYGEFISFDDSKTVVKSNIFDDSEPAIIEYTSGTTGVPKGLQLSNRSLNITSAQLMKINNCQPGETILAIMPPFISYGAVCGIHNSLSCGWEMILIPNFSVEKFASDIKKYKPNNIICVPSFFESVINNPIFDNEDVSYIKRVIFGGDKTLPEYEIQLNEWLKNHNSDCTLIKGGGMAEYASCMFMTPFDETKKPGVYGIPLPKMNAKIMKNDNTECGYYEIGEIYVSGPQQMIGYLENDKETSEFFYTDEDGVVWGRTGDLGYVDTDGNFVLTSRKKQMIVRPDGHNVFPIEIEQAIMKSGYAKNCVVIGLKDEKTMSLGEYPVAFVEIDPKEHEDIYATLNLIKNYVNSVLPLRDRPNDDDYIAMNMIYAKEGKLDRNAMLQLYNKRAIS